MQGSDPIEMIFTVAVLVFSVIAHEVAHGYMAQSLGDPTARLAGRLTLNPAKHIDPVGSLLVPLVTYLLPGSFIFGWAKPVPYNPYNLRDQKWGDAKVALAGPLTNLGIAVAFGALMRVGADQLDPAMLSLMSLIVLINIILGVFNLVPIPPLDGSKVLGSVLPLRYRYIMTYLERYALFFLLVFIFFLWDFFYPIIALLYVALTGG